MSVVWFANPVSRIHPTKDYTYDDDLSNVKPGETYVDANNEIQIRGLEENK